MSSEPSHIADIFSTQYLTTHQYQSARLKDGGSVFLCNVGRNTDWCENPKHTCHSSNNYRDILKAYLLDIMYSPLNASISALYGPLVLDVLPALMHHMVTNAFRGAVNKEDRQCAYNATFRQVRVNIVAMEKQ
jgi:hypothetical protein